MTPAEKPMDYVFQLNYSKVWLFKWISPISQHLPGTHLRDSITQTQKFPNIATSTQKCQSSTGFKLWEFSILDIFFFLSLSEKKKN